MDWFFDVTNDVLNMMDGFYQPDPSPLPTLPNELILKIFSLVGSSHTALISLSTVCRKWNQLCFEDELWNYLTRARWKTIPISVRASGEGTNAWFQFYKRRHNGTKLLFPIVAPHPIENCFDSACPTFLENVEGKRSFSCSSCQKQIHIRSCPADIEDLAKSGEKAALYQLPPTDPEIHRWEKSSFNVLVMGNSGAGKTAFRRKLYQASRQNGNAWVSPRNNVVEMLEKDFIVQRQQPDQVPEVVPATLFRSSPVPSSKDTNSDYECTTVVLSERSTFQYPVAFNLIESHAPPEEISQWIEKHNDKFNRFNFDAITLGADPRLPTRPARPDKGIHLIIYCIDITDHKTFSKLERIYRILRSTLAHCPVLLLVCKADLKKDYIVESGNASLLLSASPTLSSTPSTPSSSYYSMLYSWYSSPSSPPPPSLIPLQTLGKFAKKSGLDMHMFSQNDSEQKAHVLMDSMAHLTEYGRPRKSGCTLI